MKFDLLRDVNFGTMTYFQTTHCSYYFNNIQISATSFFIVCWCDVEL